MERKGTIQGWVLLKKHFQNRKLNQPVEKYTESETAAPEQRNRTEEK